MDYEFEEDWFEEYDSPSESMGHRRLAIQCAFLVCIFMGLLGYFVVPASATGEAPPVALPEEIQTSLNIQDSSPACGLNPEFAEKIYRWCDLITQVAFLHNLDPNMIGALILQESGGNPTAYSHSGAVGLMQVMPRDGIATKFECPNGPCFAKRPTIKELEDPTFNVEFGTGMLANLIERKGNFRDALKSYGPMDVGYGYADKVLAIWQRYRR